MSRKMPADVYLRQLRVLGAWWRLGSSALDPQFLACYVSARDFDWSETDPSAPDGVVLGARPGDDRG